MRGNSPAAQLLRALIRRAGPEVSLDLAGETPWSSATFVGAQIQVVVSGDVGWADTLEEIHLPMRGYFVASVEIACTPSGALLTVLVLED